MLRLACAAAGGSPRIAIAAAAAGGPHLLGVAFCGSALNIGNIRAGAANAEVALFGWMANYRSLQTVLGSTEGFPRAKR